MSTLRLIGCLVLLIAGISGARAEDRWREPLPWPALPEAISSFGAAVDGDYIYVFGGHAGRIPGNSLDALSPHFVRLNVKATDSKWEPLAMHHSSQSPGLVAWNGQIYRVGGLSFKNKLEEETQFHSLANFAKYDPKSNTWADLPALPEPRSSLDAAVVDGQLYVVGGWNLQDKSAQEAPWHDDALVFDLSKPEGAWKAIATPPFTKRAIAVAAHNHKLYVLGGMTDGNQTSKEVHVFDPATNTWATGPELPGKDGFAGFACSAFAAGGKLYFNGSEGVVYVLNDEKNEWEVVQRLAFPRSFHRLLPIADDKLVAIAGVARGGGYLGNVEIVDVSAEGRQAPMLTRWSVKFPGKAKHSQTLLLQGSSLYAFGGNGSRAPHDFSKENILAESFRFDLAARTAEELPPLPAPVQSGVAHVAGTRIDQSIYVMGGITFSGDQYHSTDAIHRYRMRSKAWSDETQPTLPSTRAMLGIASKGDVAWLVGGAPVNTDEKGLAKDTWTWNPTADDKVATVAEAAIPVPRRSFGGVVIGSDYFVVGGLGEGSKIVANAAVFSLESRQWKDIASPSVARVFPSVAAVGGKVYLSGGFAHVDGHFQAAKSVEAYDPKTNQWTVVLPELPFDGAQMAMLEFQDRLLFFGVDSKEDGLAQFALLDLNPQTVGFGAEINRFEEPGGSDLAGRLMRMDKNSDGKLSADEVGERFRRIIERVDADKDGVATKEEIDAHLKSEADANRPAQPMTPGARGSAAPR